MCQKQLNEILVQIWLATWKDIDSFYNNDKTLAIRTALPKLTEKHLHPNGYSKMKVKYATQIFSHTVAAAICSYVSMGGLPQSDLGTAVPLFQFDSIFDCVNSSTIHSTKKMKCSMSDATSHQSFTKDSIKFIMSLEVLDGVNIVTGRIKCLQGWLVTLNAILQIWEHLKTMHDFKFLLTRRLNSDPIENFFGAIRQQGGNSDKPTPVQFTRAFRKLFFSSFLESSTGNCDHDLDTLLAQFPKINQICLSWSAQKNSQIPWTSVLQIIVIRMSVMVLLKPMQLVMWQGPSPNTKKEQEIHKRYSLIIVKSELFHLKCTAC